MSTTNTEIEIGYETWSYSIEGNYTHISDDNGDHAFTLRWAAGKNEVIAAAYGYGAGRRVGTKFGEAKARAEIAKVLGLSNAKLSGPVDETKL